MFNVPFQLMVGVYQFCGFYHISLIAGILDVRRMLDFGITVGLGTSKISYHSLECCFEVQLWKLLYSCTWNISGRIIQCLGGGGG